jgi:hypothetical protein
MGSEKTYLSTSVRFQFFFFSFEFSIFFLLSRFVIAATQLPVALGLNFNWSYGWMRMLVWSVFECALLMYLILSRTASGVTLPPRLHPDTQAVFQGVPLSESFGADLLGFGTSHHGILFTVVCGASVVVSFVSWWFLRHSAGRLKKRRSIYKGISEPPLSPKLDVFQGSCFWLCDFGMDYEVDKMDKWRDDEHVVEIV